MKKSIYIFSEGKLRRKDNTLCFESEEGRKYIPVEDTSEIMAFGEVSFNRRLIEFLSQKEICLHYFNYNGYYMGTFYPREHLNSGHMLLKQAEHYLDENKRLKLAEVFVSGALGNIRQVLKYYSNRGMNLEDEIAEIEYFAAKAKIVDSIAELMAMEGNARELYYKTFDLIIGNTDFPFEKRTRRPPKNHLNTLISFGNSVLYVAVLSEIYKTHLDPRIGYLHTTNFRRFSLNLDVAEIFKPIVVDRVIFTLVKKKMISRDDFEERLGGLHLKESGKKTFIAEFDKRMQSTIKHRQLGRNVSYRRFIRLELYKVAKHLIGEKTYSPFMARW